MSTTMTVWHVGRFGILFRWRGSLWRIIWKELLVYFVLYFSVSFTYRFAMSRDTQKAFNQWIIEFNGYLNMIPITFLLGFYVSSMVTRYFHQFSSLAWPDDLYGWINLAIPNSDEKSRLRRRTMVRYLVLSTALSWRDISTRVRKRFPRMEHLVRAGLMTKPELEIFKDPANHSDSLHWMIPIDWCQRILEQLVYQDKTLAPPMASHVINHINFFKNKFRSLHTYNWLSVPLAYTQVATFATYSYFLFSLIGRQFILAEFKVKNQEIDFYIPVFTTLQFLFYVGWLKVGQYIMCPFGESDDDFELNAMLDRHLKVGLALVDGPQRPLPDLTEDIWCSKEPCLPHTMASARILEKMPKVRTGFKMKTGDDDLQLVYPELESNTYLPASPDQRNPCNGCSRCLPNVLKPPSLHATAAACAKRMETSKLPGMKSAAASLDKKLQKYATDEYDKFSVRNLAI